MADSDAEVLSLFRQYGFNVHSDCKKIGLGPDEKILIEQKIVELIQEIQDAKALRKYVIESNDSYTICVIKIRLNNPKNNRGKSSGLRIYALLSDVDAKAIIFHIYPKDGSDRKDNINAQDKNNIKRIMDLFKSEEMD